MRRRRVRYILSLHVKINANYFSFAAQIEEPEMTSKTYRESKSHHFLGDHEDIQIRGHNRTWKLQNMT